MMNGASKPKTAKGKKIPSVLDKLETTLEGSALTSTASGRRKARPISSLVLGKVGGIVAGRVRDKSVLRSFEKDSKVTKVFNFVLYDTSGEVPVMVMGDLCTAMYDTLIEGRAFRIMNFKVVATNKQYDKTGNGFQLQLTAVIEMNFRNFFDIISRFHQLFCIC